MEWSAVAPAQLKPRRCWLALRRIVRQWRLSTPRCRQRAPSCSRCRRTWTPRGCSSAIRRCVPVAGVIARKHLEGGPGCAGWTSGPHGGAPASRLGVEANFKETQLRHMRAGHQATCMSMPILTRRSPVRLRSLSPGTGSVGIVSCGKRHGQLCEGGTAYTCQNSPRHAGLCAIRPATGHVCDRYCHNT